MKNISQIFLLLATITFGCGQASKDTVKTQDSLDNKYINKEVSQDTSKRKSEVSKYGYSNLSIDSLLKDYIVHSKSELVKLAIKDNLSEEWLFDQMVVNSDTNKYYSFQIGHDVKDEGRTNPRFVTDQWIYIDSLTHQLFEYDIVNDTLLLWTK